MARKRKAGSGEEGLPKASRREARWALLARAAAAGEAPQEQGEEEELVRDELVEEDEEAAAPEPRLQPKRSAPEAAAAARRPGAAASAPTLEDGGRRLAAWAEDTAKLERWLNSRGGGLEEPLLSATSAEGGGGGMLRLRDFFPADIAEQVLAMLEALPEEAWEVSEQGGEDDAARHRFCSADLTDIPALAPLRTIFWRLLKTYRGEPTLPIFSAGRYGASDFIGRHDDRAHVPFFSDDNVYSRTVAAIWYLTRDWSSEEGGHLLDLDPEAEAKAEANGGPPAPLVPAFNSLVAFEVPRMHAVTAVTATRYRYSIFGWWHQSGKRYELPGELPPPSSGQKAEHRKARPKRRSKGTAAEGPEGAVKKKMVKRKAKRSNGAGAGAGADEG